MQPSAVLAVALLALIPVTFDPGGYAPLRSGEMDFGGIWEVLGFALLMAQPAVVIHRASAIGWGGLLAWGALCALAGLDPIHPGSGPPERRLGFLALVILAMAFWLGQNSFGYRRWLVRGVVVGLAGTGVYSVLELLGLAPAQLSTT